MSARKPTSGSLRQKSEELFENKRKRAEELKESELKYRMLADHMTDNKRVMAVFDEEIPKVMTDPDYSPALTVDLEFFRRN